MVFYFSYMLYKYMILSEGLFLYIFFFLWMYYIYVMGIILFYGGMYNDWYLFEMIKVKGW